MINIFNTDKHKNTIYRAAKYALDYFDIKEQDGDIEVALVSEKEIKDLNARLRGIDSVTDVLSFPSTQIKFPFNKTDYPFDTNPENNAVILGEVYICLQRAKEQSEEYGHSLDREIAFLTVHGVLHLLGYDHPDGDDEMEKLQENILNIAGFRRESHEADKNTAANANKSRDKDMQEKSNSNNINEQVKKVKVGSVAIIGRPNSGKSTLINALTGEKVSIVSWKPQTTRNRILGIMNTSNAQVLFLDTPGLHAPRNALGKFMMRSVTAALEGVDIVVYVVDGEKGLSDGDGENINRYIESGKKVVVTVNKVDRVKKDKVAQILSEIAPIQGVSAVVPISALRERNIEPLKQEIFELLDYGLRAYPEDMFTDKNMRFMAAETIREKTLRLLDQEIPFGIGVMINKYEMRDTGIVDIDADIICQKAAHKPIILGKGGSMIKKVATYARQDLEEMIGSKVFLTLWVRVKKDWRDDGRVLDELGYNRENY